MKIISSVLLLGTIYLLLSNPAIAQNTTTKNTRDQNHQTRQEVKTTVAQVRQEKKIALTEAKQKKIQIHFEIIQNNLIKRHDSLIKLKNKIEARINKNPGHKDTTQAKTDLSQFNDLENKYQTDMANLVSKFKELKNSDKPSDLIKGLKDTVALVRTDLENIKKLLVKTTTDLAKAPKLTITPNQ
ncbi:MAG: hypothetical protein KIH89_002370 [Candidatus Shapirobacteria bacterium]|nr:hypothetical protein [Candidatus Shapirobacteria bacterium]